MERMTVPPSWHLTTCRLLILGIAASITPSCREERASRRAAEHVARPVVTPGRLVIKTARATYRPREAVLLEIQNGTPSPVYLDLCVGVMEGNDGRRGWSASDGVGRACRTPSARHTRRIGPGETAHDTWHMGPFTYRGRWRIQLGLRDSTGGLLPLAERTSNEFTVVRERIGATE